MKMSTLISYRKMRLFSRHRKGSLNTSTLISLLDPRTTCQSMVCLKGKEHFFSTQSGSTKRNVKVRLRSDSAGMPDFIEKWSVKNFRRVGYALSGMSMFSLGSSFASSSSFEVPIALFAIQGLWWYIGTNDINQKDLVIRRNFPVLGNVRYIFETIRPEIRQYFIEGDHEKLPFSRAQRHSAYKRSVASQSILPFGTKRDVKKAGYEWCAHSLYPTKLDPIQQRVNIGGSNPATTQPYSSSLLNISAMSYGALSSNAILALSSGAKLGNFSHNTGEGGISKFHKEGGADIVWNIGTAYFGCGKFGTNGERIFDPVLFQENAKHVKMIEIKLSQGAKPAHGGILPKEKITQSIAEARNLPFPSVADCTSPPCHSAFSSAEGLCEFIKTLRELSGGKPVGFKLCIGQPEEFSQLVHAFLKTGIHPDFITVDGSEGGTGAAPVEFSDFVGAPLNDGLSLVHSILVGTGFRDPDDKSNSKIALIATGKIITGDDMYKAFALGADVCNAARPFLFSLGCIQALKCHTNHCPTGITTQNPDLTWGLDPAAKKVRVANFQRETMHACVELMEATGVSSWANIKPHHVIRRIDNVGTARDYGEIYVHLQVQKGELLEGTGPERLLRTWDLDDGIVIRAI